MSKLYIEEAFRQGEEEFCAILCGWDDGGELVTLTVMPNRSSASERVVMFSWDEWLGLVAFVAEQYEAAYEQKDTGDE